MDAWGRTADVIYVTVAWLTWDVLFWCERMATTWDQNFVERALRVMWALYAFFIWIITFSEIFWNVKAFTFIINLYSWLKCHGLFDYFKIFRLFGNFKTREQEAVVWLAWVDEKETLFFIIIIFCPYRVSINFIWTHQLMIKRFVNKLWLAMKIMINVSLQSCHRCCLWNILARRWIRFQDRAKLRKFFRW